MSKDYVPVENMGVGGVWRCGSLWSVQERCVVETT